MALVVPSATSQRHAPSVFDAEIQYRVDSVCLAIEKYLGGVIGDASETANFADTPVRAARAHQQTGAFASRDRLLQAVATKALVMRRVTEVLATGFPLATDTHDGGIVVQGPITASGLCPHHFLPVAYVAYVAYHPKADGTVLGLSKLTRLTRLLADRPVLQEQVAADIADALFYDSASPRDGLPQIETAGSAVQLIGWHSCMASRGVRSLAPTLTTALRGTFTGTSLKAEFYQAVRDLPPAASLTVPGYVSSPDTY